eukprot:CAMPEP_0168575158 /NCGR_PEP_ID=MMETSP0413-20121227/19500_1 /TAXON_ID=136452 /ORGANISM="Filamoeba nolandi, Strain NC-AS-23-1" /LENGTH=857 /DNA_ID=CAMNT_0008608619 /DNA_START=494 /DNA_END=3067 /DNA_ORIENTATION=+
MTCDGLPKDSYKKVQCILVSDETVYCINPTTVFMWPWKTSRTVSKPRTIPLKDPDPNNRPLINIQQDYSAIIDTSRLLLANGDTFQVWHISQEKDEMKIMYDGKGTDQSKYFGVFYANNRVLTYNKNSFNVWNITRPAEASRNPVELAELMLITAVYVDDAFIIFGQSDGSITLRDLSDGKLLYYINDAGGATQGPTQTAHSLIDYNLERKVNSIQKYGRWIFAVFENSRFAIFDITKEKGTPIIDYSYPKGGIARQLWVGREVAYFTLKQLQAEESKSKKDKSENSQQHNTECAIYGPKLGGWAFYYDKVTTDQHTIGYNTLTLLPAHSYTQITGFLQNIAKAGEDVKEFTTVIDRVAEIVKLMIDNPKLKVLEFLQLKEMQKALDEYESLLEDLMKTGRLVRFFTSSRLRRNLEFQNNNLHTKLNGVEDIIRIRIQELGPSFNLGYQQQQNQQVHHAMKGQITRTASMQTGAVALPGMTGQQPAFNRSVSFSVRKGSDSSNLLPRFPEENQPMPIPTTQTNQYIALGGIQSQIVEATTQMANTSLISNNNAVPEWTATQPSASSIYGAVRVSMIQDLQGREWWNRSFGEVLMVEWPRFMMNLTKEFPNELTNSQSAIEIQTILDNGDTGYVSQYKFAEFLKGFGPFRLCLKNVKTTLAQRWFHGFLSSREAELLFKNCVEPEGTFLVRFSKSKPGSFALAFVVRGGLVKHILIESRMPESFRVSESEQTKSARDFASLQQIVDYYNFVLKTPYTNTLSVQPWFHGDIDTNEANELLRMERIGTYLIRFSSKECFAASFVDAQRVVRHVLIATAGKSKYQVDAGNGEVLEFSNIPDLVRFYEQRGVFLYPLKTTLR